MMYIGELAGDLGINPKTIRYYESIGLLLPAPRTPSGYRLYSEDDRERLRFIKAAQGIGLALDEIKEILAFRDRGDIPCPYVLDLVTRHTEELGGRITELRRLRRELLELHAQASKIPAEELAARGRICHIVEAPTLIRRGRDDRKAAP